ncbi:TerC family protein [Agrobacterium larrymoorei]|uniref:TerC family protein n=1 Tax=Agrobacterium larrymoorei TaxID=160699 RepID=A0A4D7DX33_9HYPH|nr:TerC family protein [Agrobacterium larrymoorei]QCJ00008.1 TerC family protein [Agrobacterium larrymoorei]QYA09550.1 TerC family protein [Agrobacterium larrymoorei]
MIFEWMTDPAAWAGLATLIVLEIVLGIDNLVFIAILADKLPEHQREKARLIGLSLALGMRLVLLASVAWIVTLTAPLFTVLGLEISGRDLILLFGGFFLLFKGTMELHERLEGHGEHKEGRIEHAVFWQVLVQIVVLDAVFSLDSVITAVGMVQHLSVMMIAVIVAVGVMLLASKPLMAFVSKHPTVVILCLGFLMMIGFSLIVEGLGFHIPKGYLYAAIGFSVLIEAFNQIGRRNREKFMSTGDLRERTANAVLSLLGRRKSETSLGDTADVIAERASESELFTPAEHEMIESVLSLADRSARSLMTPRLDIDWLDIEDSHEELQRKVLETGRSRFLIARDNLDEFLGVALAKDLLRDFLETGKFDFDRSLRQPLVVHESVNALRLLEQLRQSPVQVAIVLDEYGSLEGIVTPTDLLEAIAGEFTDDNDEKLTVERAEDGSLLVDGWIDIRHISKLLEIDLVDDADRYSTLAGLILWRLGHLPEEGATVAYGALIFEVVALDGRNIDKVRIRQTQDAA